MACLCNSRPNSCCKGPMCCCCSQNLQALSSLAIVMQASTRDHIPPFYFPGTKPVPEDVVRSAHESLQQLLASNPTGFAVAATKELVTQVQPPCLNQCGTRTGAACSWCISRACIKMSHFTEHLLGGKLRCALLQELQCLMACDNVVRRDQEILLSWS